MPRTWLPQEPAAVDVTRMEWWRPRSLEFLEQIEAGLAVEKLSYVVVDELLVDGHHEGVAGLVISPWPRVDERGRQHFGAERESIRRTAPARALERLLARERVVVVAADTEPEAAEAVRTRDLAIGDVFAARLRPRRTAAALDDDPASWLRGPVLDVSEEAREAAKTQAAATAAGAAPEGLLLEVAGEFGLDAEEEALASDTRRGHSQPRWKLVRRPRRRTERG